MTANPRNKGELQDLSDKLKTIAADLYDLESTASDYPADAGSLIAEKIRTIVDDLRDLEMLKDSTELSVPQDVVEYIEGGRNPNVYTRQFSEAVTRESQNMLGKMTAHRDFATALGDMITAEFPNLSQDVARARNEQIRFEN